MTVYQLQKDLGEEIEQILKDMILKDVKGNPAKVKSYPQNLPKRLQKIQEFTEETEEVDIMGGEEGEEDPYPYCIIRADSGNIATTQGAQAVNVVAVIGIFDDDVNCLGHQVILNMLHKIAERFTMDPVLKDRYRLNCNTNINWILDPEDRYPYYFGAMEMTWDTFFVGREDKYA
ncbi:MAG: hypothetical protein HDR71_15380 [Lachnospiraceae bacterium]|nr:hypothetical protein [Lachnospiraceae bacterium]